MPEEHQRYPNQDGGDEDAPLKLVAALRQLRPKPLFVPPTIDEAIVHEARRCLSKQPKNKWNWRWILLPSLGAAVVVAVVVGIVETTVVRPHKAAFSQADVNHDGRVDILDAFALARELSAKGRIAKQMDLNGDGVVDDKDVELIAAEAVKLRNPGRS